MTEGHLQRERPDGRGEQLEGRRTGLPRQRHLRPVHTLGLVAAGVVGLVVAFWALAFIAGVLWGIVKIAVVVALIAGAAWLLLRRRH